MSSGFISEAEIAEQRQIRAEEWKKIRTADQPLEPPEEPRHESKPLYQQLQDCKQKRDQEYEETHKLKNMIKVLDAEEVEFLELVDKSKLEVERKKNLEEQKEMKDFKAAVSSLQEETLNNKLMQELQGPQNSAKTSSHSSRNQRLKILPGVVVKKSEKVKTVTESQVKVENKRKLEDLDDYVVNKVKKETEPETEITSGDHLLKSLKPEVDDSSNKNMKCIGILPGLGSYVNSSDSDCTSDSDEEQEADCKKIKYDILGRKIVHTKDKDTS